MDPTMKVTRPSEREVRVDRILDAPREMVWRAFTEPDLIARWWARGNDMNVERFEVRPGGHWRFVEHAPDGEFGFEGRFGEVEAPARISQTFEWDGAPGHVSLTAVEFQQADPEHTRVIETTMFMTAEDGEEMLSSGMLDGMSESYAALDRLLASMR
jgi:uncharacterized protein YndB with AHSA1/START domain